MTDESQPDDVEDPKPDQDEQALAGTGNEEQDDLDTAREMETIVPTAPEDLDSATIPGVEPGQDRIVLEGDAVPGYDLLGELGRGGMGVVYKARDQKLKRIVALKMILSGTHASEEDMQRFQTEAEAVAKLQHPNIVQIFEVSEHEGRPYIALEFADGGSLDQKIAGTPQNAAESAQLVETLARAMQQAHDNDIIHRDLKPANILLTADGEPRITDFGLAKRLDEDSSQTKSGAVMGTPSYMAPEQAASTSDTLGPAADTYALGAILYHMLTGRPPFQAETQLDTIMQVIGEEPVAPRKLNSSLPVDLETICLKCLEKDVHRRYESAEALAEDLRRFQAGEPILARPVSVITRGLKWARRRPAVAGMIGISAAALVVLVTGGLWYNAQLVKERDVAQKQRKLAETREGEAKLAQANEARQRERAEEQKEAADRNFKLARDAVDELTTVSQNELFNLPRMEPVREALLQKAKEFYEKFVDQAADDPQLMAELGKAHILLGRILYDLGDPSSAESEEEKAIEVFSQLVNDHPDVPKYSSSLALSYNNLGISLETLGKRDRAIEVYNAAIAIRAQLAEDRPDVSENASELASSYSNLAVSLRALGRPEQEIELYNKAIVVKEQLVKDHPDVLEYSSGLAASYNNLAIVLSDLGKTDRAIELHNKAIRIAEQLVKDHPDVPNNASLLARSCDNLGLALKALGQTDLAIGIHNKAIRITEQLVKDHPDVPDYSSNLGKSYSNLAIVLSDLGEKNGAIELHNKATRIREQLVKDRPDVPEYSSNLGKSYNNLAIVLSDLGQTDRAIELYSKATRIREQLVKDHPDVPEYSRKLGISYYNLASSLKPLGKTKQEIELYSKAILIQEKLVEDRPDVPEYARELADSYNNLANSLKPLGKTKQAVELHNKAILIQEQLVKDRPDVPKHSTSLALSYNNLANSLKTLGKTEQGIELYNKAIRIREQLVKDHPDLPEYSSSLGICYYNLANSLKTLGKTAEAIEEYRKASTITEQLVNDHPDVPDYANTLALSYNNLAVALMTLGQRDQAMELYNKTILTKEQLVKDHPNVPTYANSLLITILNCGVLEQNQRRYSEAIPYYEAALPIVKVLKSNGQLSRELTGWDQKTKQRLAFCRVAKRAVEDLPFVLAQPPAQAAQLLLVRGQVLLDRRDHTGAAESGEKLVELELTDDQPDARNVNLYNAACLLSLASAAAAKDEDLAEAERKALVDKYATRAVALLKEDRSLGYFKDPENVAHMKKDTDLDSLREWDDFKQLLKELEEDLQK